MRNRSFASDVIGLCGPLSLLRSEWELTVSLKNLGSTRRIGRNWKHWGS